MIYKLVITCIAVITLNACGIKGDLVKPSEIDEYNKKREENRGSFPL